MPTTLTPRTTPAPVEQNTSEPVLRGPGYRPLTTVVLVALRPDGRTALVRHASGVDRGRLALVGGRLEAAEWLDTAVRREALQSLGIRVESQDIEFAGLLHHRCESGAGRLCAIFTAQRWAGEPRNAAPGLHSEVVWADPGGLPADCHPLAHAVLDQYVAGTLYNTAAFPSDLPGATRTGGPA
ncbi:NUDIX domain-containing protein [Streptomyces sp. NBC_00555]|uniref:NUDIX domain-containing protein n=1 Tax=Streptomyces sp. NBC_00555 TaxID=2903662 RepID=UPI00225ACD03|nr:NUDIX domain-containing protein [Streptomyces sp. NBC_00555]MCX5016620.1 NUDIX domain-containing protein [Streptomyces sp. NBC_00555]